MTKKSKTGPGDWFNKEWLLPAVMQMSGGKMRQNEKV